VSDRPRSKTVVKFGTVAALGAISLVLFLAGEGGRRRTPEDRTKDAQLALAERDAEIQEALASCVKDPDVLWSSTVSDAANFDNLRDLLDRFPEGTTLELLDGSGTVGAWAGPLLSEGDRAAAIRPSLRPVFQKSNPCVLRPFGVFLCLGRGTTIPRTAPPLALTAWDPPDLIDCVLRPYFPHPTLAADVTRNYECTVQFLLRFPEALPGGGKEVLGRSIVLPGLSDSGGAIQVREGPTEPSARRPGPLTSFFGGLAALLLVLHFAGPLLRSDRLPALLKFPSLVLLCAGGRWLLRLFDFPGRLVGGPAFDPELFHAPSFLALGDSAGDFLITAVAAGVVTYAFLRTIPEAVHRLVERSRAAAAAVLVTIPFSVPLLSLLLLRSIGEFLNASAGAGFLAGSPVDFFPTGSVALPLPGTLLLIGFFLFALCFTLLGISALHVVFRAMQGAGEGRAALLTVLSGAAATAVVLGSGGWTQLPVLTPAAVLLVLHPIHLKLRREGVTALHTGVFLFAAAVAAFPGLQAETLRVKKNRVEALTREAQGRQGELLERLEETVALASGRWRGAAPKEAPYLSFLLWAKSALNVPGISAWVRTFDREKGRLRNYVAGSVPPIWWDNEIMFLPCKEGEIVPVDHKGWKGYLAKAGSPDNFVTEILARLDWPPAKPPFPPPVEPSASLAFARYEKGQLTRATRPGLSVGRPLPEGIEKAGGRAEWIREEYPWGKARVLYIPEAERGAWVSAALPVPPVWGNVLGFLRLFLSGVVSAAAGFLAAAFWEGARSGRWGFHRRLKYRLGFSFALISVFPIFLLGYYTESESVNRIWENLKEKARADLDIVMELLQKDVRIVEKIRETDDVRPGVTVKRLRMVTASTDFRDKAKALGTEWDFYLPEDGSDELRIEFTSREEVLQSLLIPRRLPAAVHRALVLKQEAYRFDKATWGGYRVIQGYLRVLDRDFKTIGVVATSRSIPAWMVDAMIAREASMILSLYLLSLVLVGFFGLILARHFAAPLERLNVATRAVAEGDLKHRVDITSRDELGDLVESFNRMTAQLEESREALVRAEKESAWREMARQIAHEIKNPLTPMKLSAQHILRAHRDGSGRFEEILQEGIRRITEQIDALGRIAQEFSDFARFPKRDLKPLALNPLVREAVQLIGEEARSAGGRGAIEIEEIYEENIPEVVADEDEIRRLVINLLRNAFQAMAERGGKATVSTRVARVKKEPEGAVEPKKGKTRFLGSERKIRKARHVEIRVADTGPGIPESLREKLFQPYFSTKSGGTGLGLAICKKAVDELGGEILIESEEGVGTTVIVRLLFEPEQTGC
jgi:signal transduction histidine kinase